MSETDPHADPSPDPHPKEPEPRTIPAAELFQGGHEVLIEHRGEIYRLMITNRRRLILKK